MTAIDYEEEYDNRARVPEHPAIFARWERAAATYRERMRGRAGLGIRYGDSARQAYDIFPAEGRAEAPLAVFIHGGWWGSLSPSLFSQMATGLNARGIHVAIPGYDLCPSVSIAAIVEQMRAFCLTLWRAHGKRLMVAGHSAGGHLAACMLATEWRAFDGSAPDDLVPAAYAVSGIFDLAPLLHCSQNADLRLDCESARQASPYRWKPPGTRSLHAVVGREESGEFLRQSKLIADTWAGAGVATRYEEAPGNHFTVIDALADPESAMTARAASLCEQIAALPPISAATVL